MIGAYVIIGIVVSFLIFTIVGAIVEHPFFCRNFGWHKAPRTQGFDGCSFCGKCPACGKNVLQDSQGGWF